MARQTLLAVYRYRLIDAANGADLGPLVSSRLGFEPGELLTRSDGRRFELLRTVPAENENFRAYLVVTPLVEPG